MKIYKVRNWEDHYENNRTRELRAMSWIPIPNNHDGDGYTQVMAEKNGLELFGAWIVIVQVASKCGNTAGSRGVLVRGNGTPHDAISISRISRVSENKIQSALDYFSTSLDWLIISNLEDIPHEDATIPHEDATPSHLTAKKERKEWNGTETPEFKEFWKAFPINKGSRKEALRLWEQLGCQTIAETVVGAVKAHAGLPDWNKDGGRWVPSGVLFLKDRRWENKIKLPSKNPDNLIQLTPEDVEQYKRDGWRIEEGTWVK